MKIMGRWSPLGRAFLVLGIVLVAVGIVMSLAPSSPKDGAGPSSSGATAGREMRAPLEENGRPLVIAARGESPGAVLDAALAQVGGMKRFVKQGDIVLIKPNATWARTPDQAATTDPVLLSEVIKRCKEAGAKKVIVGEHSINSAAMCLKRTGIGEAAEKAGAEVVFWSNENQYRSITAQGAEVLRDVKVSNDVLDADVLINMPKAKHHSGTKLTLSLKNMMGVVWDMGGFHRIGLEQAIAELNKAVRADLIIVDATTILTTNGPGGPGVVERPGVVVLGTDPVAVDAWTCLLFKRKAEDIGHIKAAHDIGVGDMKNGIVKMVGFPAGSELK